MLLFLQHQHQHQHQHQRQRYLKIQQVLLPHQVNQKDVAMLIEEAQQYLEISTQWAFHSLVPVVDLPTLTIHY